MQWFIEGNRLVSVIIGLLLFNSLWGQDVTKDQLTSSEAKEIERFSRLSQAIYYADSQLVKRFLDTLDVPEHIRFALDYLATYRRLIMNSKYKYCLKKTQEAMDKLVNEYQETVPEHHYKWITGVLNYGYASCSYYLQDFISSYFGYKKAYDNFASIGDSLFSALSLTNMATVLTYANMYSEVLNYYVLAKKYFRKDTFKLIPLSTNIGAIYFYLERPDIALRYYNDALSLAETKLIRDSSKLTPLEKKRLELRIAHIKLNIASLFLDVVENRNAKHNIELLKKLKASITQLLDSARAVNNQVKNYVDLSKNPVLFSAFISNELKYWELKYELYNTKDIYDSLKMYIKKALEFYDIYSEYDREGEASTFRMAIKHIELTNTEFKEMYNRCVKLVSHRQNEIKALASSLTNIDMPSPSTDDVDKLLGELPYQCSMRYAVSVGIAILFGTILVLLSFLYSRTRRIRT